MLAQNFKTAMDLGIRDVELDALIKVLGMLEREEVAPVMFNMRTVGRPDCGTPGCILGHVRLISIDTYAALCERAHQGPALHNLFIPGQTLRNSPYDATPEQAAIALRSYLTTGEPNWAEAMA